MGIVSIDVPSLPKRLYHVSSWQKTGQHYTPHHFRLNLKAMEPCGGSQQSRKRLLIAVKEMEYPGMKA